MNNLKETIENLNLNKRIEELNDFILYDKKKLEIEELEKKISDEKVWNDIDKAKKINQKLTNLKKLVKAYDDLKRSFDNVNTYIELIEEEDSKDLLKEAELEVKNLEKSLKELEIFNFLGGKYDNNNCYLSINSGAGGTESCDWAQMIMRMYTRWLDSKEFSYNIINIQKGDKAGIKSCNLFINGDSAFGYLKGERGIHRLVRISPFDSNKRRHTSFCSVDIIPEIEEIDINIEDKDLKITTFRASGAGGQHVNTTDSAVRIIHIPTNIMVSCQMERSQHKNKDTAMKMLKSRIKYHYDKQKEKENDAYYNQKEENAWGSQMRSYVMHPYKMVKDLINNYETSSVEKVLDGDLDAFIFSFLKSKKNR